MPKGPTANWNRHQYKKPAMPVYPIAASAGSRGNVGKLRPAGHGESDQRAGFGNWILKFPIFLFATRIPGAGQDVTGLTAAVQLRLRVAVLANGHPKVANFDSEVLALTRREAPACGRQVRIRGNPPVSDRSDGVMDCWISGARFFHVTTGFCSHQSNNPPLHQSISSDFTPPSAK